MTTGATPRLVGLSVYHADAAAAAVVNGRFVAGVEEERLRRVKHWAGFPEQAIRWCLDELGGPPDAFAVARQPQAYLARKAWLALTHPRSLRRSFARAKNLRQVQDLGIRLRALLPADSATDVRVIPVEHHLAHAASAFYCSPFEEAACLTVDGFGDFVSTMLAVGRGSRIEPLERVHFPHSLGILYTAVTQHLGFLSFGDEYKVMGLAAYGEPRFVAALRTVVPAMGNGLFHLDLSCFRHLSEGVDMTWDDGEPRQGILFTPALEKRLGAARRPDEPLEQRHMDLAASLQAVYEERFFALVREVLRRTGMKRLALAGGCGLNSLANGKLFRETPVEEVFIQSAAGDSGTSLGAALWAHHAHFGGQREFVMEHSYWGPLHDERAIHEALVGGIPESAGRDGRFADRAGSGWLEVETVSDFERLANETAAAIAAGEVIGWYQGRSEWGPRALGNRSILADPRRGDMKELLNVKIKRRESFRPFAPSILEERVVDWFEETYPDPFMLKVYPIRSEKRDVIPAVTHADGTGRLQTVSLRQNERYWKLIAAFERHTGVPLLLNTSFNENEPIVDTPAQALDCFLRTRMDRLVMGNVVVRRSA